MKKIYESGKGVCHIPKKLMLVMKLTAILVIIFTVQVSATVYSQNTKLSLNMQGTSIKEVLQQIEALSEYRFIYENEKVNLDEKVSIRVKDEVVENILKKLFEKDGVNYSITESNLILINPSDKQMKSLSKESINSQQKKTVSGKVTDTSGATLPGVSVVVKGSTNGTITNSDGNYSLSNIPDDATLQFSFVGMKPQEIPVAGKTSINVTMTEDAIGIEEVVAIGYGTQKKVNLTGSVGIAQAKELESRPVSSATQALQGLVPGLKITTNSGQLDKTMSITIRGAGTIGAGSSGAPLVLIDGMQGDLNLVNPQDIEAVSVLKDAAASSIYGSRAPFGVILVTTKKGKDGKISINYNNSFRISNPINLPKSMDSYMFANMMNEGARGLGVNVVFPDAQMQKMLDYQAGTLTAGLDANTAGTAFLDKWTLGYGNADIWREMYKSEVFSQEHNLSMTGGSSKMLYYVSFNYLDNGGLLKVGVDGLNRYNLTGKITATLTNWLKFNYSSRFTRNDSQKPIGLTDDFYPFLGRQSWPNIPMYYSNGQICQDRPRQLAEGGQTNVQDDTHYNQAAFVIEPIKNWITNIELNYSIKDANTKAVSLASYDYSPSGLMNDNGSQNSSLQESNWKENYLNINAYSEYSRNFADAHNFKVMGGFQAEQWKGHYFSTTKYGLQSTDLVEFNLTSGLSGKGAAMTTGVSGYSNEWATAGFFGRMNYDYKGKYLAEINMRYDGTSRFQRDSRWQLSPSFSAGWNIAKENFFQSIDKVINQLKIRGSYGELGNQNTTNYYPTYRSMSLGAANGAWIQSGVMPNTASVGSLISTSLTWENVRMLDAGLDYGFLNNRLTGSFDYFIRHTNNMVGPAPQLPITLGVSVPATNNCDLQTRGWELSLNWKDRLKNGLNYNINISLSDQQTYIDSYPGNKTASIDTYMAGKKIGLIWGYETIGIAKSNDEINTHLASLPNGGQTALGSQWGAGDIMYRDLNGDGKISGGARTWDDHGDLKILGDANSHYFYGIDLTADWKGFDFRCFLQGLLKQDFWPGESSFFWGVRGGYSMWYSIGLEQHEDYFRANPVGLAGKEIPANLDSYFPRPIFSSSSDGTSYGAKNQYTQSRYMQNAAYMRLKNLQIGYTLPIHLTQKAGISKCRIFMSGENLLTLTSLFSVFDPETATGGWGGNGYPLSKIYSFGLSVTL